MGVNVTGRHHVRRSPFKALTGLNARQTQAAQAYFGSSLDKLGDTQFAALVAMIKAPNQFHPRRHPEAHRARLLRVQAVLGGACKPAGWFDTTYAHCGQPGG